MRFLSFALATLILLNISTRSYAVSPVEVSAEACVLMYEDGTCLYEKNADSKHLVASTTKIMTAILAIENLKLNKDVKIKSSHCNVEGSSMYLKAGETYSVKELLLGLMLASGNDAALALADACEGGIKAFAELMNSKAEQLGMANTHFTNPNGLDHKEHYSTARDMAKLMLYCMKNDIFREITGTKSCIIKGEKYSNHNKLLNIYPGCTGGKTGFTVAAGRCLVSFCERDGIVLACVSLSAPNDWQDHMSLYDYAFANYSLRDITQNIEYQLPVVSGSRKSVTVVPSEKIIKLLNKDEKVKVECNLAPFIFAPVNLGETAGELCVIIDKSVVAVVPLVFAEKIDAAYPCCNYSTQEQFLI